MDSDEDVFMMKVHLAVADAASGESGNRHTARGPVETALPFAAVRRVYGSRCCRAMRKSESSFALLVHTLRPILPFGGVSAETRVSMSLRYFAGASYLDVRSIHGVSKTTFYDCVWDFVDAMLLAPGVQMRIPHWNADWRRKTAAGFQARVDNPLINVIGSLDGIDIRQEMPSYTEVICLKDYWNRKGFFALNFQAICDHNYEFVCMSWRTLSSTHVIAEALYIAAEEAYGDRELLATPWPREGRGDEWRDAYSFYQWSARMHIEQALGQLVWRWGILWRPLRMLFT